MKPRPPRMQIVIIPIYQVWKYEIKLRQPDGTLTAYETVADTKISAWYSGMMMRRRAEKRAKARERYRNT